MKIVSEEKITIDELKKMSEGRFGNLVKAVVDIKKGVMAVDAELHADQETVLLEQGSDQGNLWGINIYPEVEGEDMIEFDSMINLRPAWGNRSRGVDDETIQKKIIEVVFNLIEK